MRCRIPDRKHTVIGVVAVFCFVVLENFADGYGTKARADQGGSGFWLLGTYASEAAIFSAPGLTVDMSFNTSAAFSRRTTSDGHFEQDLGTHSNYLMVTPSYALATPVLGGQFEFGTTILWGNDSATASTTPLSSGGSASTGSTSDSMTAFGDLFPQISLKWNWDAHNVMVYTAANVPIGTYDVNRLSSVGLGFWAVDSGIGYTYYDERSGGEFSAVLGFTYNFMNERAQYQNGIDMHLELSVSQYVTNNIQLGVAGYLYDQLTPDSGPAAVLGPFMSQVAGVGPQLSYDFSLEGRPASLSARGYYELAGQNRPEGLNVWLNLTIAFGPFGHKLAKGR